MGTDGLISKPRGHNWLRTFLGRQEILLNHVEQYEEENEQVDQFDDEEEEGDDEDEEGDGDGVFRQLVSLKNKSCMDFQISCKDELKVVSCKSCKCRLTSFM